MPEHGQVGAEVCAHLEASGQDFTSFPTKPIKLGNLDVERALPVRRHRLVGPWCFLDRFGPLSFADGKPMDVAPHPHIGLQTVTWLLDGEIAHDDSLGCESIARPGGVNVMTAGHGIAHTEQTPPKNSSRLNGVQLWAALPDADRHCDAHFEAILEVPWTETRGGLIQVFAGSAAGLTSPARYYSGIIGADLTVHPGEVLDLDLDPTHEHALLPLSGDCELEGRAIASHQLHYLGIHRNSLALSSRAGGRMILIGGPPFPETILMWWNFVARTPREIAEARADWEAHRRFGDVRAYEGPRIPAPELVKFAQPNPLS